MGKLIIYGNCQSAALYEVLRKVPEVRSRWEVVLHNLWATGTELERDLADFDECAVLIQQDVSNWRSHPMRNRLNPNLVIVRFPFCYFAALWPFDGHQNGNDPGWCYLEGEGQFGFTDNLLGRLRSDTPDPEERFQRYRALDIPGIVDIVRYAEYEEARLLRQDLKLDSNLGKFIVDNYRSVRLFHAVTHLTPVLLQRLAEEIIDKLGILAGDLAPYVQDFHRYFQVPLHPEVISRLSLRWADDSTTYNFHNREELTFDQYYRRYIKVYG